MSKIRNNKEITGTPYIVIREKTRTITIKHRKIKIKKTNETDLRKIKIIRKVSWSRDKRQKIK